MNKNTSTLGCVSQEADFQISLSRSILTSRLAFKMTLETIYIYTHMSRDSSVGIATDQGLDDRMIGVRFPEELEIFVFATASTPAVGPIQPPIQWVPGALSLDVKRPAREANHSHPSNAEVKECVELYFHFPIRLHGVALS
jgi:hypothetical protein